MKHVSIMIKPASGLCNMRCSYCFYRDITQLRNSADRGIMSDSVLEQVIRSSIAASEESCAFVFQGGEPTMAGLEFFEKVVRIEKQYRSQKKLKISNAIQTNGLCLDENWTKFFHDNKFLVGLSLDGTKDIHDRVRLDSKLNGTYTRVLHSAKLLRKYGVEFNILTVITKQVSKHIQQIYNNYSKNGWGHLQFIPCLDQYQQTRGEHQWSLQPNDYAEFLRTLFDCWYRDMKNGKYISIRYFDDLMEMIAGYPPTSCGLLGFCPQQIVVESNGDVYPCDFYVMDEWKCGTLLKDTVEKILSSDVSAKFCALSVPASACRNCKWELLCRSGCRRDRDRCGTLGENYYCSSFKSFFEYAFPKMAELVRDLY